MRSAAFAGGVDHGAGIASIRDPVRHTIDLPGQNQRPHLGVRRCWVADPQRTHPVGEPRDEPRQDVRMHEDPLHRHANLTRVVVATLHQWLDDRVELYRTVDDDGRRSAMLKRATRARRQF